MLFRSDYIEPLLSWFYDAVVHEPKAVPTADEIITELVRLIDHRSRFAWFNQNKKHILTVEAFNIVCSLTNWNPDAGASLEIHQEIASGADEIAGAEAYDPLSRPVLRALTHLTIEALSDSMIKMGTGKYSAEDLAEIFQPRELLCLDACVKHWYLPEEWPWQEVLDHTKLGLIMDAKTISYTGSAIARKLTGLPQILWWRELDPDDLGLRSHEK